MVWLWFEEQWATGWVAEQAVGTQLQPCPATVAACCYVFPRLAPALADMAGWVFRVGGILNLVKECGRWKLGAKEKRAMPCRFVGVMGWWLIVRVAAFVRTTCSCIDRQLPGQ